MQCSRAQHPVVIGIHIEVTSQNRPAMPKTPFGIEYGICETPRRKDLATLALT